ncbi:MAG TPA: site-specific integrase [Verrucomicrobiota bacterium]|nr:site-specific integrase [Verrucomicrobiota bacterium]
MLSGNALGLEGASGTRNVHRQILWRLFAHCERRGYIPRGTNPVAATQTFNRKRAEAIEIWTPKEMAKPLSVAEQDFLLVLAVGAFAGLRTSEILALDWRDVRLKDRTIKVAHRKARCAGTRLAPIPDNLLAWLKPLAKKIGPVWSRGVAWKERGRTMTAAQNATAEAAGLLPWRHNGLRHAFCSCRVAATQDVPRTALEAGNSVSTVFAHYRALATEAEGRAWFPIIPPRSTSNVARLQRGAKA